MTDRIARLRSELGSAEVDAVLVSQPESRRYLSGYAAKDLPPRESAGYLVVSHDSLVLLTDPRTEELAAQQAPAWSLAIYGGARQRRMSEVLGEVLADVGVRRLGFESQHLTFAIWKELTEALEGAATLVPTSSLVEHLRAIKDPDEIDALRASIDLNDQAFAHIARGLHVGIREIDLAWEVERFYRQHGAEDVSFDPITVAGPNTAVPHAEPTERPIRANELVLLDMGARLHGYCSDMTRTLCLGSLPAELERIWQVVLEAQLEAEERLQPGMTGGEVDAIARQVIDQAGYGEQFVHGLGHGIGLEIHEPPWITRTRGEEALEPGMVFSIEPGVYLPGVGGVRIEDLVLLTEVGAEVLSHSPKKLRLEEVLNDLDR